MSEISDENPKKILIVDIHDPVSKTDLISNISSKEDGFIDKSDAEPSTACAEPEICEKYIEEIVENGRDSKSETLTNSCTSSLFESSTSSVSVSNDSSPSRNEANEHTNISLDVKTKFDSQNEKIQISETSSIEVDDCTKGHTSLDPAHVHSTSTISLNEPIETTLTKASFSKSADNVSTVHETESKSSTTNLDTEKILSEFSSQKAKVAATQKLTPEPENLEYTRLPKEILSQDLGSIVKNVHGIFSSVSGSIKNAYNISNSYRMQKQPMKPIKIPNNRILNEIFDEDNQETSMIDQECPSLEMAETEDPKVELDRTLEQQKQEIAVLKERLRQQSEDVQSKEQTYKDIEAKMEVMRKRLENAEREKDAAVMRYAGGERAIIEAKRLAETSVKAEKNALNELELVNGKLKSAHAEKQRICRMYDDKCHELLASEREVAKLKEDAKEIEGRLKWTQSKLRMEMDAYRESAEKVEKLEKQVSELETAKENAANNAADTLRAKQLESELKEIQAALILCRHENEDLDRRLTSVTRSLEACQRERDGCSGALSLANEELKKLRESNVLLEEEASQLASLRAHAALASSLTTQLQRESERASQAELELSKERARAETCRAREAHALEHAAQLTALHVSARAGLEDIRAKEQALSADNASLRERVSYLEEEATRLTALLGEETERRNRENKVLARKVAELTEELSEANKRLEWEKGENCVLQKKHASAIKELNRELARALRRRDQLEAKLPAEPGGSTRTGSVSSLSSGEGASTADRTHNGNAESIDSQAKEPDRQALIERIVSLQRAAARRSERTEFLEEHCRQLTIELRNKARVIRQALCQDAPPQCKDAMKRDITRLGGAAMAAVWGGDPESMSRELSLEMNRRLQAVLEDALLKNICLKENIDTLSKEIARLKQAKSTDSTTK